MTTKCRRGGRYCWKHSKIHGRYNRDAWHARMVRGMWRAVAKLIT